MKPFLSLLLIALVGCAPFTRRETVRLLSILGPSEPPTSVITMETKFAAICPYCVELNRSRSCLMSGGSMTTNGVVQSWTISFKCRHCKMPYSVGREQILPGAKSVQLPVRVE